MRAAIATQLRIPLLAGLLVLLPGGVEAAAPLAGRSVPETGSKADFERHVMGLFGRMGCNSGACHGSFQGRGGFRLSLFGYDPAMDYLAVTRDAYGRRLDPVDPERSLLLLKPLAQIPHGGGKRFSKNSWQYRLLRDWITAGAHWQKGSGTIGALEAAPAEVHYDRPGRKETLRVTARFADGSAEDVTRFCDFRVHDDGVAGVTPAGEVTGLRPGDTSVLVSYRGQVTAVHVLVPRGLRPGLPYPRQPEATFIDREVFAKLRVLNIIPSPRADDAELLRRVTIDTIGRLPSPEEVRSFLADRRSSKYARKIDELLANPEHASLWATKFCDITGNDTDLLDGPRPLQVKESQMWHDWFRKRLEENMPYDKIVKGVLCATSREGQAPEKWLEEEKKIEAQAEAGFDSDYPDRPTLDLFWRRRGKVPVEQWGEKTAAAFLGIRLECAQCHKHPFDRWTQADYRSYANIFGSVVYGVSPEARKVITAENAERRRQNPGKKKKQLQPVREVFVSAKAQCLLDPETRKPLPARALGGPNIEMRKGQDPRLALFEWLRAPGNPYFARSFVNRVWAHYLGVGLVDPADNFSVANPPSNPRLLDALAHDFVDHGYDIRRLERTIVCSRVYQLASTTNETNRLDRNNYSHAYVRPLMAEVVVDVINAALGTAEAIGPDAPAGSRAIDVGVSRVQNGNLGYVFRIFGRPPRTSACDCQRAMEPALPQTLYRMTDATLLARIRKGRLGKLLSSMRSDDQILEELFLAALSRYPNEAERAAFRHYRTGKKNRQAAFTDTLWALVNTREFLLNH